VEKLEFSPSELMQKLNWKKSKIYYWINSNKFETIERETGKNVLITQEQIERLRSKDNENNSEIFENDSDNFENVQKNSNSNVTKHYETVSENSKEFEKNYYLESLETIKQIHQSSLNNFNYSMKLLTDGKNELEQEYLEQKAINRSMAEKIEQKEKDLKSLENSKRKLEYIIIALVTLVFAISFLYFLKITENFKTVQKTQNIENVEQNATISKSSSLSE